MRAHGDAELRRHEHYRENLVDAAQTTAVDLTKANCLRLHELLEDHAILALLTSRDADRRDRFRDSRVAEHVVRARGLFDPPGVEARELRHVFNRIIDIPHLIRVEHQLATLTNHLAHDPQAPHVVGDIAANLDLEVSPAIRHALATQLTDLLVAISQ